MLFSTTLVSSIVAAASLANAAVLRRQVTPGDYTLVFTGQTGAVQSSEFITFSLVDTIAECTAFCDSVTGCGFANSYHDNNGKGGSPLLTCSLYVRCHDEAELTNTGGQTQPDGSLNYITDSDGWCKTDPTTTAPPVTSTPVTTADPTTDPVTDPAPTSTVDPTTAPEPTSTADPTTAPEPTSTADATTDPAPEPTSTAADPTTDPAPEPTSTA